MTLDEAIKHCEEKAKELYKEADTEHNCNHKELGQYCFKCAREHEQLAEWLKELKALKENPQGEWIVSQTMDCHSDIINVYTCPFCGKKEYSAYPFCHCGAKLKGGAEE